MSQTDQYRLCRDVVLTSHSQYPLDAQFFYGLRLNASDRHEELGRSDIAKHFQLPLVTLEFMTVGSVSNSLTAVFKQGVGNLMGNRIAQSASRPSWVVFDANVSISLWNGPGIADVRSRKDRDIHEAAQSNRIERRAGPALIHCFENDFSSPSEYGIEGIIVTSEQLHRRIRPATNSWPHAYTNVSRLGFQSSSLSPWKHSRHKMCC
uniref:Uncharacterized protein n=1 Tax=Solibacter usitatus (strain Ellin6076) TaxID=234267 RepID=Q01T21_SOLUE